MTAELCDVGAWYYYAVQVKSNTRTNQHPNILKMNGLAAIPGHLCGITELINPDDRTFVHEEELMKIEKINGIGFQHMMQLKNSLLFMLANAITSLRNIGERTALHKMQWIKAKADRSQILSKKEVEIIVLLAKGLKTGAISSKLHFSDHTVKIFSGIKTCSSDFRIG